MSMDAWGFIFGAVIGLGLAVGMGLICLARNKKYTWLGVGTLLITVIVYILGLWWLR